MPADGGSLLIWNRSWCGSGVSDYSGILLSYTASKDMLSNSLYSSSVPRHVRLCLIMHGVHNLVTLCIEKFSCASCTIWDCLRLFLPFYCSLTFTRHIQKKRVKCAGIIGNLRNLQKSVTCRRGQDIPQQGTTNNRIWAQRDLSVLEITATSRDRQG